jgi:hypothetical protein
LGATEPQHNVFLRHACLMQASHFSELFVTELARFWTARTRHPVHVSAHCSRIPSRPVRMTHPSLCGSVSGIIARRAQKEMCRFATWGVVARVADHYGLDGVKCYVVRQHVREAVCIDNPAANPDTSVSFESIALKLKALIHTQQAPGQSLSDVHLTMVANR